jgi:hypothetical protein
VVIFVWAVAGGGYKRLGKKLGKKLQKGLGKSPTLARNARIVHPTPKAGETHQLQRQTPAPRPGAQRE